MVTTVVTTMDNFRDYSKHCQQQMEGIREHMKIIRERRFTRGLPPDLMIQTQVSSLIYRK